METETLDIENIISCWDKLCRICLTDQEVLFPVFSIGALDEVYNMSFSQILNLCSGLQVAPNDNLPQLICSLCITHMHNALEFRIKCHNSDNVLSQLLQEKDDFDNDIKYEIIEIKEVDLHGEPSSRQELEDSATKDVSDTDLIEEDYEIPLEEFEIETLNDEIDPELAIEERLKTNILIKEYNCRMCQISCSNSKELAEHKKTHATTCSKCCIILETTEEYNEHMKEHKVQVKKDKCLCTVCGKKFGNSSALSIHLRTHTKEKRYECEYCGKKFLHWNNRRYHIRNHHTLEKPFACKICDFRFAHKTHLVGHMQTHSDERPFGCTMCESKFKRKSTLNKHMYKHTGEKKAFCEICEKGFVSNSKLKIHMVTHTGLKEHICEVCSKAFTQPYELRYHMKRHQNIKIEVKKEIND